MSPDPGFRQLTRLEAVVPAVVVWLWHPYLARGRVTLLEGPAGVGCTAVCVDLAARLSRGGPLPQETRPGRPRRTLYLNGGDPLADTVRPRLDAAGADLGQVFAYGGVEFAPGGWRFPQGCDDLIDLVGDHAIDLVVVDPLAGFVVPARGRTDPAAGLLYFLASLALRTRAAVLAVHDPARPWRYGPPRSARMALRLEAHPDRADRRVLVPTRATAGPLGPALDCRLAATGHPVAVEWLGVSSAVTAGAPVEPPRPAVCLEAAKAWLLGFLADGPWPAQQIFPAGERLGHSRKTLYRAKAELGVTSRRRFRGFRWEWYWYHPKARLPGPDED